jgi:hypothetical protein
MGLGSILEPSWLNNAGIVGFAGQTDAKTQLPGIDLLRKLPGDGAVFKAVTHGR